MTIGIGPEWEEIANIYCLECGHSAERSPTWVRGRNPRNFRCTRCGNRGVRVIRSHCPKKSVDAGKVVALKRLKVMEP
jgi:hypothetical protein